MADLPADRCVNLPRVDIPWDRPWPHFAMEYLEGQTLADRLSKGRLPLDQAVRYATEIAGYLGAQGAKIVIIACNTASASKCSWLSSWSYFWRRSL